ncbi:hypothetical protein GGI43DRAFT_71657 [Trichoderma evansii]
MATALSRTMFLVALDWPISTGWHKQAARHCKITKHKNEVVGASGHRSLTKENMREKGLRNFCHQGTSPYTAW